MNNDVITCDQPQQPISDALLPIWIYGVVVIIALLFIYMKKYMLVVVLVIALALISVVKYIFLSKNSKPINCRIIDRPRIEKFESPKNDLIDWQEMASQIDMNTDSKSSAKSFADYAYQISPTCKENQAFCLSYEDVRHHK